MGWWGAERRTPWVVYDGLAVQAGGVGGDVAVADDGFAGDEFVVHPTFYGRFAFCLSRTDINPKRTHWGVTIKASNLLVAQQRHSRQRQNTGAENRQRRRLGNGSRSNVSRSREWRQIYIRYRGVGIRKPHERNA